MTRNERSLIIGCDFQILHTHWRSCTYSEGLDVVGFIYCKSEEPPIKFFSSSYCTIRVYPLRELEQVIKKERVDKCLFQESGISIVQAQSIINRVLSTKTCRIEFAPPKHIPIRSFKPLFVVSSISPRLGKTQIARYFCHQLAKAGRLVGIIIPITNIDFQCDTLKLNDGPHYQFLKDTPIPDDFFCKLQIQEYRKAGAFCIYVTSDVRKSIICAEQKADIIIYDSWECECPFVLETSKFCCISKESINNVRQLSLWPGLVNTLSSPNLVIMLREDEPDFTEEENVFIKKMLPSLTIFTRSFFYARSKTQIYDDKNVDLTHQKVLTVDHQETKGAAATAIKHSLESNHDLHSTLTQGEVDIQNEPMVTTIPRCSSPTKSPKDEEEMNKIAKRINGSNVEIVVVSLQRDFDKLLPGKIVLHTFFEITDINNALKKYLSKYFPENLPPPLKEHFEAQADILMSMARASDIELYVSNNDSSNRESFCRLFLSSHLPPGFRVTTGEIIDSYNNNTGQLDVVIVNDECPKLTIDATGSVIAPILADYVLGVVEVKTTLGTDSLKKALSQLRHVKALMPSHETLDTPNGTVIEDPLGGKIVTGIFAFGCTEGVKTNLPNIIDLYPNVADFIVLPNNFSYFSVKILKVCGFIVPEKNVVNGYVCYTAYGSGLAILYGVLNFLAAYRRFNGSNCIRYLNGSWGGTEEVLLRLTSNIGKYVDILAQNISVENKGNFYQAKSNFMENLKDLPKNTPRKKNNSMTSTSLPPAPSSTNVPFFG
ncbi:hypothetical protein GPJ56_007557 [Histomonas meleagridis]|uniref:Uncharacterized protein n=1 Tax=Histomonas meleagridis TaxID=135588 RepID=UPI00355984CC|nr:hypothetical protein GPJ56_007557 [Histomonas meleagridis]KAH0806076.1 Uncharacterized protein GO595_001089 [Histomonas meleagridis]